MRNNPFSFLLLVIALSFLATCQSGGDPTAIGEGEASPTLTPSVESPTEVSAGEQGVESSPQSPTSNLQSPVFSPQPSTPGHQLPTPSPQPLVAPSPQPIQGGQVVVGGLGRPDTLNPLLAESEADRALVPLLFDSLLAYDSHSGQLTPRLADVWTIADDSQSITFTLRADARWHDGQPVTAGDVVFTIETARDPALDSLYGPQLNHVTEVSAPDDATVVVSLDGPDCPSLAVLGELLILPQHLLTDSDLSTTTTTIATTFSSGVMPAGSGPFVFIDWTPDGEVHLARNGDYWGDAPYLDAWSYRPFENVADLGYALESGQIDVALMPPGRLPNLAASSPSLSIYRYLAPEFLFVAFSGDHPILGDPRVRLALSMAVDREQLLDQIPDGSAELAEVGSAEPVEVGLVAGSLPPMHWAADPALRPPPYDPDGARQLLAELGWADSDGDGWLDQGGERLQLPVRTNGGNQLREDVAMLVASYYRAIGVDASVELVLWGTAVDDLFTHDFEAIVFSWPLRAEPDQSRWWLSTEDEIGSGYNFVSFADETVDQLLREALAVPNCDPARRAERYRQVQRVLAQERPYDFLFVSYATVLSRPGVYGVTAGPFAGPLESADAWYIKLK